jgi:multiple sugar transport system permease protein
VQFEWLVLPLAWDNYARVLSVAPLAHYAWNSAVVAAWAVPLTVLTASWSGFALTQAPARVRAALLLMSVLLLLVPGPALWLPRFVIYTELGWINTLFALIAPALMGTSPFYVVMFYIAFARVDGELYDSARLEGAHLWQVWYRVGLPLARPTAVAVAVLSFVFYWSNFVDPFLYLRSEANYTLPVGIQLLQESIRSNWPLLMAAAAMMAAPVVLVFVVAQRTFLQGEITLSRWLR